MLLTAAAWMRGAEYDEQYTLFLTAGTPRPAWPETVFTAETIRRAQEGNTSLLHIARDLRATDVHPPVYFWTVALWRRLCGPGLLAARMLSVLCGMVSIALVRLIARTRGIQPLPVMLVMLGCYGFVYTGAIVRGFAISEMLTLGGVLLVLRRRALLAGVLFGAACACNYLAVFAAAAVIAAWGAWAAFAGMAPFLALDLWFFIAQHGARPDQFPPFALLPSVARLGGFQAAAVFGGLPLYCHGAAALAVGGLIGIAGVAATWFAKPWRDWRLLLAAAATPLGLLLLGAVFNNTPIELRYLSFALPFIALLFGRQGFSPALLVVLTLELAGTVGLLIAPATMQPARDAARSAVTLVADGLVLLPRGNDGVGIVGAFGIEAPPSLDLLLVRSSDTPADIAARIGSFRRVGIALLAQDQDSRATLPVMRAAVSGANWRRVAIGSNLEVYERTDPGE